MNEMIDFVTSGFWHILHKKSHLLLAFLLLLFLKIDLKNWTKIGIIILLFTTAFFFSLMLKTYQMINLQVPYTYPIMLFGILLIGILNYFELFKKSKYLAHILAFVLGLIQGLRPLGVLGIHIKQTSIKVFSALATSIGIFGGLLLFAILSLLAIVIIQLFSKVNRKNTCNVLNALLVMYSIYAIINYYHLF